MKSNLWRDDTDEYKLEPLTVEMVKNAEKELKVKLPESYIQILKQQNGGYINLDSYPCDNPNSWADDHVNIENILGIGEGNGILQSEYLIEEWNLPNNVVLISGDGHSWIALDYRSTKEEPPVIFIDVDSEPIQILELAPNFESFLKGLTIWENDIDLDESPKPQKKGIFSRLFGK